MPEFLPRIGRRTWFAAGATTAIAASVPLGRWLLDRRPSYRDGRFGRLRPDPKGVLDLLEGFHYRVLSRVGDRMSDGQPVPARPDGMACFDGGDGTLVLMRNHELPAGIQGRFFGLPSVRPVYDPNSAGGVTRVVLDAQTFRRRSSNLVLAGTTYNCCGGASPWGWLSCEETVDPGHGYVFLCDPSAEHVRAPRRIEAFGRFRHEAAAVNPENHVTYLSEDQRDGCLYRFVPHDPAHPFEGQLQALRIPGRHGSTAAMRTGEQREIAWVTLPDPDPEDGALRGHAHRRGAAAFRRGEGLCARDGTLHLCASTGGPVEGGQIFRIVDEGDGGTLEVLACSTDRAALDMPDNVCIAPSGTLFFVEDGVRDDYLRGVTGDGEVFELARNAASEGEMCGVCFSPDGRALFVNLQDEGLTLVVQGPFETLVG